MHLLACAADAKYKDHINDKGGELAWQSPIPKRQFFPPAMLPPRPSEPALTTSSSLPLFNTEERNTAHRLETLGRAIQEEVA